MINNNQTKLFLGGIQHFSLSEGNGVRTSIYVKGCPLRCAWCCNPELHNTSTDLMYISDRCIGHEKCGKCLKSCQQDAIYSTKNNTIGIDRELCNDCGNCFNVCPAQALFGIGQNYTSAECIEIINKDREFIDGVTISGGEPFMRPNATLALVEALVEESIPIAISTSGFFDLDNPSVIAILQKIDTLYFDIKHFDAIKHKNGTGLDNTRILSNFTNTLNKFPDLECKSQTLIVPGYNDDQTSLQDIALFLSRNKVKEHIIYFYHSNGEEKYTQLGRPCLYTDTKSIINRPLDYYSEIFNTYSIELNFQ